MLGVTVKVEVIFTSKKILLAAISIFLFSITGCGPQSNRFSLPSSAKTISANTIEVPFPYSESTNGERWTLSRDSANHLVVQVSNGGKIEESFSVVNTDSNALITLGGQKYTVSHITVNNDNQSGYVTLVKQ